MNNGIIVFINYLWGYLDMNVRIINLEKELINLKNMKNILSNDELLEFCINNKEFLNAYVEAMEFKEGFKDFSLSLYNSMIKYPNILNEIDNVVSNMIIDKKDIEDKLMEIIYIMEWNGL